MAYGQTAHKEQLFSGAANAMKLFEGQDDKAGGQISTRFLILFKELFNAQSKLILSYYEECEDIHTFRRDKIGGVIWKKYRKGSMLPTTF